MANGCISIDRVLNKLDEYLNKNDYLSAERHLLYWLSEAENGKDFKTELLVRNELMGLYRKLGKKQQALDFVKISLEKIDALNIGDQVGSATTYLNCGTVYKAFDMAEASIPLFEKARSIYEDKLEASDSRLAGLYNNMALALVDLKRFSEAKALNQKAISIMENSKEGDLEVAITYLNMASAAEAELGLEESCEIINEYLKTATDLLENHTNRDGYYAFVCEKCASVFGYYGYFIYEDTLKERARRIYEGS